MKARTSLLITHRLIGLENMDEILVMEGGRILERGRLADLLSRDGLFRLLWDLQNRILDPGEYSSLQTKECMR
jgi:ABC-type multidrug transport system fused ATPase/permease subunit